MVFSQDEELLPILYYLVVVKEVFFDQPQPFFLILSLFYFFICTGQGLSVKNLYLAHVNDI
jgi:hypothetical protein